MGYMRHHAVLVTSWREDIGVVHAEATRICGHLVSNVVDSNINGFHSFFVAPDGSKEGWPESDEGDAQREQLLAYLETLRYEDGSTSYRWALVQYGDDMGETVIVRHSDVKEPDIDAEETA